MALAEKKSLILQWFKMQEVSVDPLPPDDGRIDIHNLVYNKHHYSRTVANNYDVNFDLLEEKMIFKISLRRWC